MLSPSRTAQAGSPPSFPLLLLATLLLLLPSAPAASSDPAPTADTAVNNIASVSPTADAKQVIAQAPDRYRSLTLTGGVDEYFTTNAFSSHSTPQCDFFTVLQAAAVWMPHLTGNLYGEITISEQLYRYARFSSLSINNLDAGAGLIYIIPELKNLTLFTRYNYNLITNASADNQIYHDQTLAFGLQHAIPYGGTIQALAYGGLSAEIILEGWPGYSLSETIGGYLGNEIKITRHLKLNTLYQLLYLPFLQNHRADWSHFLSASLTWEPLPYLTLSASTSGIFNVSNDTYYSYDALNVGASLAARLQF